MEFHLSMHPLFNTSVNIAYCLVSRYVTIISSLVINNEIKSVIILNGHHGNVDTLDTMEDGYQQLNPEPELKLDFKDVKTKIFTHIGVFMKHEFDHAGFVETSIMLAISDKVKMKKAKKGLITKGLSEKEIRRIKKLSTQRRRFSSRLQRTECGVTQLMRQRRMAEKFLAEIVRNLTKECQS